ncbi:MAG: DNA ligase-associated DEXH box helicase, partial [bacterium]
PRSTQAVSAAASAVDKLEHRRGGRADSPRPWPSPPRRRAPLECLVQHMVTLALGGGFEADALFSEVRTTASFATLERADFDWCLELALCGGRTLSSYPQYHRIARGEDGRYGISTRRAAQL